MALLERQRCALADTGHTTAHLTAAVDLRLSEIEKNFGGEVVKTVWDAGMAAIEQIEKLVVEEAIDCDFVRVSGTLHAPIGKNDDFAADLAVASAHGIECSLREDVLGSGVPGLAFPNQALFHPRRYLATLVSRLEGNGSYVFEQTDAHEISQDPVGVRVGKHVVSCRDIIVATHTPITGLASTWGAALFQTKLSLYTSYALSARIPAGLIVGGLYWDTGDPYSYLRVERKNGYDLAVFGGKDHKTGQADERDSLNRLCAEFSDWIPKARIEYCWSGQVVETSDGLPYLGAVDDHQFIATGFAGNGMTFGTLGGMMAAEWVAGIKSPWVDAFSPARKIHRGGTWDYLKENKDYPFLLVKDWLMRGRGETLEDLHPGQGRVISYRGKKVAAYRQPSGDVLPCSAVCTHLKCTVKWNDLERTWDCPCHGSRFRPSGEVLTGPAEEPLPSVRPVEEGP